MNLRSFGKLKGLGFLLSILFPFSHAVRNIKGVEEPKLKKKKGALRLRQFGFLVQGEGVPSTATSL